MKPIRLVDLRVLLESACGVALVLALLMPFFTVSAQNVVPAPVKAVTSITDAIPHEPLADLFVVVALVALSLAVLRMLRPGSGYVLMVLSLASFGAAGVLVAVLEAEWSEATSGWQMDAARLLGAQFSQSFGFWVFLGAAVVGGVLVITEIAGRLAGRSNHLERLTASVGTAGSAPSGPTQPQTEALSTTPPAGVAAQAAGGGRVTVVESGRSTAVGVSPGQTIVLGRDPGCDVRLGDPRVSRRHAAIQRMSGEWVVRDLGATNATMLIQPGGSQVAVDDGVRMSSGQILVGDVLVTLHR
jgi:hypothetical protein